MSLPSGELRPPAPASVELAALLDANHRRLLGRAMAPVDVTTPEGARWLYEDAPFCLLVHDTAADPLFVYANLAAQRRFGYPWDEFVGLPSRLSAGPTDRDERAAFMDGVRRQGFVEDYRGVRVTKSGARFRIDDATVWNLAGADGTPLGQAALVPRSTDL